MLTRLRGRNTSLHALKTVAALLYGVILCDGPSYARDGAEEPSQDAHVENQSASQKRLEIMKDAIQGLAVSSKEIKDRGDLTFVEAPILRYSDSTREFFDAGVWKLGATGRPKALVTLEIYKFGQDVTLLTYEFCSLAEKEFLLQSPRGVQWLATNTDLKVAALPDAPKPADTEARRLTQMKALARRFSVVEKHGEQLVTLRLMPHPIDRYSDEHFKVDDGAAFIFATGTNPEFCLLLEAGEKGWSYGYVRLAAAELSISLDEKEIEVITGFKDYGRAGSYQATRHRVDVPD